MGIEHRRSAMRRTAAAVLIGVAAMGLFGLGLAMPALALAAFVYYVHQVAAIVLWNADVPHPELALVIVLSSLVVLVVQGIVVLDALRVG